MSKTTKASVRPPFLTRTPRPADLPEHFLCVRQAEASKLGLRAHGNIIYQTLLDPDRSRVFLRVIANSGSGSFSDEPVHVDKLAQAVANRDPNKPLRGSELQTAIVGKSVCNAGFMAAVLVAEGLLGRDAAKRFDLLDLERWQTWTAEQLATPGQLAEVRLKSEGIDPTKDKLVAVGRVVKGKGLVIEPVASVNDIDASGPAELRTAEGEPGGSTVATDTATEAPAAGELAPGDTEDVTAEAPAAKGRRRGKGKE